MGENPGSEESGRQRPQLRVDALVDRVAGAAQGEPVVVLTGLLGHGTADDTWRLYLTQQFEEYVEFDSSDVVHSEAVNEATPMDGTRVWVRADAHLQYTQVATRQVQADFLQGGITSAHLARAGAASFGSVADLETGYACTRNYVCSINPHIPACQMRTEFCGSFDCNATGPVCPTGAFVVGC